MKLYYDRRSKNPTYFIQQGIRNGKKTTTRNIKKIGRHNDLSESLMILSNMQNRRLQNTMRNIKPEKYHLM